MCPDQCLGSIPVNTVGTISPNSSAGVHSGMEEVGDLPEVGCRGVEMGTDVEVSFGEVDIRAAMPSATSERRQDVGAP